MHQSIYQHRTEIAALCRRFAVLRLDVFGSAARDADFDPATSDADFLVEFVPGSGLPPLSQFFDLADELKRILGRPVDLIEPGAIRNPFLLAGINQARETIYAAPPQLGLATINICQPNRRSNAANISAGIAANHGCNS